MGWGKVRSRDLLKVANAELQELRGQAELSGARAERAEAEAREAREARRGELEAARAESFGTFQELQRARGAAEARAGPLEARAAGLERDVSRLEAEAAALRAQLKVTGDLNATLRGRDQEQAQHIEEARRRFRAEELEEVAAAQSAKIYELEHRQSKLEVLESTQLLREACGLLEECCLERAAIAEELERGMGMLQADASILRAALRTQFEFLQQDREGFAREIAQGSPRRLSSPGLLGRTSASFPSPQALRPPGSSRASPRGLSPLSRASWPTGGGGAGSVTPTAATAAAALSAAAAIDAAASSSPSPQGGMPETWGLSNARIRGLLRELGGSPGQTDDLHALEEQRLHRLVQRDSDLLADAESFELGQMDAESTMREVEQRVETVLRASSTARARPSETAAAGRRLAQKQDARVHNLERLREAKSRLDSLHKEIGTQRRESHRRRQEQVMEALTPGYAARSSPALPEAVATAPA